MPKVISLKPIIFSNQRTNHEDDMLLTFKCKKCENICLITDVDLYHVPKRKTDGSLILNLEKDLVRLRTDELPDLVKVRRAGGMERQYHHACAKCETVVAYQSIPHNEECKLLYVKNDTMKIPWNKMKTPFVCKICQYMARDKETLTAHQKQRQHFWQEDQPKDEDDAGPSGNPTTAKRSMAGW